MNFKITYEELKNVPERYTEFSRFIENSNKPLPVLLWHFIRNDGEFILGKCKNCGEDCGFITFKWGYKTFCSKKCSNNYNEEQRKKTTKERYGHELPFKNPEIVKKSKETMRLKYGVDNFAKSPYFSETIRRNSQEKYGTNHHNQDEGNKAKIFKTWLKNWGKRNPALHPLVKTKIKNTLMERYGVDHPRYTHLDPELVDLLHSKIWWEQIYIIDGYSIAEIITETGLSEGFIKKKLKEYGLVETTSTNPELDDEFLGGIF